MLRLKRRQVEALRPRASERFRGVICTDADPEAVFGLMRVAALTHTRGQGDYVASDRVLLAELALQGTFHEVPEVLLFNRDHPSRSVRITGGDFRKLTSWFAPDKPEQFMPNWRLWREYAHAARHAPISWTERVRCMLLLPTFLKDHGTKLVGDTRFFAAPAVPTVAPTFRPQCRTPGARADRARDRRVRSRRHRALHRRARRRPARRRHPGRDLGAPRPPTRSVPDLAHPLGRGDRGLAHLALPAPAAAQASPAGPERGAGRPARQNPRSCTCRRSWAVRSTPCSCATGVPRESSWSARSTMRSPTRTAAPPAAIRRTGAWPTSSSCTAPPPRRGRGGRPEHRSARDPGRPAAADRAVAR